MQNTDKMRLNHKLNSETLQKQYKKHCENNTKAIQETILSTKNNAKTLQKQYKKQYKKQCKKHYKKQCKNIIVAKNIAKNNAEQPM